MGSNGIDLIAFDADDTLWHSEILYWQAQQRLQELLASYHGDDGMAEELHDTELEHIGLLPDYVERFGRTDSGG